jgi:hypothetical protein
MSQYTDEDDIAMMSILAFGVSVAPLGIAAIYFDKFLDSANLVHPMLSLLVAILAFCGVIVLSVWAARLMKLKYVVVIAAVYYAVPAFVLWRGEGDDWIWSSGSAFFAAGIGALVGKWLKGAVTTRAVSLA